MPRAARTKPVLLLITAVILQACTESTGIADRPVLEIAFRTTLPPIGPSGPDQDVRNRVIEGVNGTLVLDGLQLLVQDVVVEGFEDACLIFSAGPDCVQFEEGYPTLVDLPLSGEEETLVASSDVEAREYEDATVSVDNLERAEADGVVSVDLLKQVRARFLDWPDLASLRVAGEFVPAGGGETRAFVAYYGLSQAVLRAIDPPLAMNEADPPTRLVFSVDPERLFMRGGDVKDLSAFDFRETELLADDALDMETGITGPEVKR